MNFVACGPEECMPADDVIEACKPIAEANGCTIKLTTDVKDGVTGADVIYTDVWVSMGEPDEAGPSASLSSPRIALPPRSWLWPTRVPSSCTACPASTTPTPRLRREVRAVRHHRAGGHDEVFESPASKGLRRGREPHAHHQGCHVRHAQVRASSISLGVSCCTPRAALSGKYLASGGGHGTGRSASREKVK